MVDHSLPHLFRFIRTAQSTVPTDYGDDVGLDRAQAAKEICHLLGLDMEGQDILNDPNFHRDWLRIEQSFLIQAMARDEIRLVLNDAWKEALKSTGPEISIEELFANLTLDEDTLELRNRMTEQYAQMYEYDDELEAAQNDDPLKTMWEEMANSPGNDQFKQSNMFCEKEWILTHTKFMDNCSTDMAIKSSVPITMALRKLLDSYFPSKMIQQEVLPLFDLQTDGKFGNIHGCTL